MRETVEDFPKTFPNGFSIDILTVILEAIHGRFSEQVLENNSEEIRGILSQGISEEASKENSGGIFKVVPRSIFLEIPRKLFKESLAIFLKGTVKDFPNEPI